MYTVTALINIDNKEGGENWFTAGIIWVFLITSPKDAFQTFTL